MLHLETLLYLASVILQIAALAFCGLMVRRNATRGPWLVMAAALSAMLVFRIVGLLTTGTSPLISMSATASNLFAATISTAISLLLFISLFSIRRLSIKQQQAAAAQLLAQADAERRSSELDAVIDNMPDAVYIGTAAGIAKHNRRAMEMLGFNGDGELQRPVPVLADAIQTRDAETYERIPKGNEPFERALAGEATVRDVVARNVRSGADVIIRCAAAPIFREGKVVGAVAVNTDITATRRAAEEMRELVSKPEQQGRIFDTTLSSITDFAYIFDRDGRFLYVNRPLLDLWGLTLDDAVGKNFLELKYPAELAAKLQRQIQEVVSTGKPLTDETPYTSPTGVSGVYEYIFAPVVSDGGRVEVVAGSTRDITSRKHHELERERLVRDLDHERSRLAAIIEQAPAFICTLRGPEHVFELANDRYYEIVGRRELIGRPVRAALPEVEGQGFFELLDNVYRSGETFVGSEMPADLRRSRDGPLDRRFLNVVYQALRETDGSISGIFVHGVDVTEMVRSREVIRHSERSFRELADAMPQIVWAARPDGAIDYYNRRWFEYIAVPDDASDETPWDRYLHPDDLPRAREGWAAAVRTGDPYVAEFRVRRADGSFRWFLVRALAARDAEGQVSRWFGTCTDVHDQKAAQEALRASEISERAARAEAERANEAKNEFIAVLSHELRTPLTPVLLTISLMESNPHLPDDIRRDVATIKRNVELESRLISDLLDLTRIARGKLQLVMEVVDAHLLIRSAIDICLREDSVPLDTRLDAERYHVRADGTRLQQIIWNQINNAIRHGGPGVRVAVRTSNLPDGRLRIEVIDNGEGIDPSVLPKLFTAFEQGEVRTKRQFAGLGLGLAISKKLVEAHGGTIAAHSEGRGKGATFVVDLPTVHVPLPSAGQESAVPTAASGPARLLKVLLVEE